MIMILYSHAHMGTFYIHRLGYPHYLQVKVFTYVKYIWGGIICLYLPWELKE